MTLHMKTSKVSEKLSNDLAPRDHFTTLERYTSVGSLSLWFLL